MKLLGCDHFLLCVLLTSFLVHTAQTIRKRKTVILLVSGARWDYVRDPNLKGIEKIVKNGVFAPYTYPVYPADSYPNWYSLATGLYAENHGFVGDVMYNTSTKEFFLPKDDNYDYTRTLWWNEAEPLWITAEKRGMRTALYWWPGCEVEIRGHHPMVCEVYRRGMNASNLKTNFLERVNDIIEMFKNDELSLAMMHYALVREKGEEFGPDSTEAQQAFYEAYDILNKLQERLVEENLTDEVNIIVVSDHGMSSVNENNTKFLDINSFSKYIEYQISYGASSMLVPMPQMLDKLFFELKHSKIKGLNVYKKEDIPLEYHIKNNNRTLPILIQADKGYFITPLNNPKKVKGIHPLTDQGVHGYDPNTVKDMKTIFFATGPAFKKGQEVEPLYNIDLYNIFCATIGLIPLDNDGLWIRVNSVLSEEYISPYPNSNQVIPNMSIFIFVLLTSFWFLKLL